MPKPDVSDARIPQILDAAAWIFSHHGIDGASMAQIANACQVSKATIYHYFDSKDTLIVALVQRLFAADQPALQRIVRNDAPALARLQAYSAELVDLLKRNQALAPVIAEFRARATRMPAIQAIIGPYFDDYIRAIATVIEQGIARDELREHINPGEAARAYVALVEGSILIAQIRGQPLDALLLASVEVFINGLRR